jgi:hypothetical protein
MDLRTLAKQRQLKLAHRAFHPKQQPIIGMARIVDSVLVDDDVPTNPRNSINVSQSRPLRASRDVIEHEPTQHARDMLEIPTRHARHRAAVLVRPSPAAFPTLNPHPLW